MVESLKNYIIGSLANELDLARVRACDVTNDNTHALAVRVKLKHMKKLESLNLHADLIVDGDYAFLISREEFNPAYCLCGVYQSLFIRR